MAKLVDIFLQPSKVFAAERERPTFLVPWLVLAALTVVFTLAYFSRVDASWYLDHMFDAKRATMTAKEIAQAKSMMPGAQKMGIFGAITGPIAVALIFAVIGLYYWLASKVTGAALGYKHGVSLVAWSAMPGALGTLVGLVGAMTMSPQTAIESLMLTHVDPLMVDSTGSHWHRLAQGFDLLSLWCMFLAALGWRTFTGASWAKSLLVVVLPYLVVYAVMALIPG
ncbi:YIP1 family protein [Lysobacter claricitrinus]|uniref:YIP1 family protein n=1 Tax=Lysobacter claricitrinus TaxID=3367728 RepID=UPI0037DB96F1